MNSILLVEDEPIFRAFLKRQIADQYAVLEAASPVEALDICRNHREIDVLVCDVDMGLVSGMELASLLRAWNIRMRTILISDLPCDQWTARQDMELKELPADDVLILEKPFSTTELKAALAGLMSPAGVGV
jgi:CheY-like chemotaxis protein